VSDHADMSDDLIDAIVQRGVAQVRGARGLRPDGLCHFCDEEVAMPGLFCDADCRDDFEKEQAALRRAGK